MTVRLEIQPQPNDFTCGPTCLHAVYRYWGEERGLDETIREVQGEGTTGTLGVRLGCHALRNGYRASLYTYNLTLFDPTWFVGAIDLVSKLEAQRSGKADERVGAATQAYIDFLSLGGQLLHEDLSTGLLRYLLDPDHPVLTGLSATYLYGAQRETSEGVADDIHGGPVGHFVVLAEYDETRDRVLVADPLYDNPPFRSHYYWVDAQRLIGAILLGIVTYDANLLVIEPR